MGHRGRDLLLPLLLSCFVSCSPECGPFDVRSAPTSSEADFVVQYPAGVSALRVRVTTVPENPDRPVWVLEEQSPGKLANPLPLTYGVVPEGMAEVEKALPVREGALVRVTASYPSGSVWVPVCSAGRLYRRVGGRFTEAPEGK
jgi:hypothetical protein